MQGNCRDVQEGDAEELATLQEAEAAVNKVQQVLHLSLPIADPDAGMHVPQAVPSCI